MQRDTRSYIWDALHAADLLSEFSRGKDFDGYQG